jgi:3D (Asp-Asp-Asp) domain-containing protein
LLDVTLRAFTLGLVAWIVAVGTWAAFDMGATRSVAAAELAPRAQAASRGGAPGERLAPAKPGAPTTTGGVRVTVVDGGWPLQYTVWPGTVLDLLRSSIYTLGEFDRIDQPLDAELAPGMIVRVIRGSERLETVAEPIPAGTTFEKDPSLLIGDSRVILAGHDGSTDRTYRVRTEDGVVVQRQLVSEAVTDPMVAARVAVGTHPLTLHTATGDVSYVRALNVLATYYTPANGGKAPDSPAYGITATGARATRGIVAVDPRVIPMYSWLYIPGYGIAQARDVGGAIIGNHIDVAFDDGDGAWWGRRYVTVYLLAP